MSFPGSQTLSLRITTSFKQSLEKGCCDLAAVICAFWKLPALRPTAQLKGPDRDALDWMRHAHVRFNCAHFVTLALLLSSVLLNNKLFKLLPYFNVTWCNPGK